jgi:hypothetical protein
MSDEKVRRFGESWRLLAHREGGPMELQNQGAFDELILDDWLHIEQMEENVWWIRVGDARLTITLHDGDPPTLDVERGFYAHPRGATTLRE